MAATAFFLGLLWSRTRSLPLTVLIHGATDLVPNLTDFASHFHLM
jgi:membrane protease YdiL (CAAX protease family)